MTQTAHVKSMNIQLVASAEKALQTYDNLLNKMKKVNEELAKTQSALKTVTSETNKVGDSTEKVAKQGETLKKAFSFGAIIASTRLLTKHFTRARDEMAAYIEDYNLYIISLKSHQKEALRFQNELNESWGTNMSQTMRYQGFFMNLTTSLGIAKDFAYDMSRTLTQLTYDMASFFNWTSDVAYQRLQAGIVGQTKPLRYAGIDVTQQTLQPILEELGIDMYVTHLTQAEKVMLRYISILRQTTNSQGDYARTMESTASQLKMMNYQISETYRWFGATFIGLVQKSLPYLNAFLMVLKEIFKSIATLLGVSADDFDFYTGKVTQQFDDFGDDLDVVNEKVNALKGALRGFDEINNITLPKAGGDSFGGGLGATLTLQNELDRLMKQYESRIENVKSAAYAIRDRWMEILGYTKYTNAETGEVSFKWERLTPAMVGAVGGLVLLGAKLVMLAGKPLAWLLGLGGGKATAAVASSTTGMATIGAFLGKLAAPIVSLGGWVTGLGTAAGTTAALLTGLGTIAVAAGVVVAGIKAFNWLKEDAFQMGNVFEDVSKTTKDTLIPVFEDLDEVAKSIVKMDLTNGILSEGEVGVLSERIESVSNNIISKLGSDKNQALQDLEPLRYALTEDKFNRILGMTNSFYDDYRGRVESNETRIKEIIALLGDETVQNKRELRLELNELQEQMRIDAVDVLSATRDESLLILGRLKDRSVELSKQQTLELIAEAQKTKQGTIDEADEQYHRLLGLAEHMYDIGAINQEGYELMIEGAYEARQKTIEEAEAQYQGILKAAKENFPELNKYINLETGKMNSNWDIAKDKIDRFFEKLTGVSKNRPLSTLIKDVDELQRKLDLLNRNALISSTGATVTISSKGTQVMQFADGGFPNMGELFIANEAGPELVGSIGSRSAVMNNDQIVASVSQGVASAVASVLGGRSSNSGTTVILKVNDLELGKAVIDSVHKTQNVLGLSIV